MKYIALISGLTVVFASSTMISAKAQSRDANEQASAVLRLDSTFVWVPAVVRDQNGGTVSDPSVSHFHLMDNGVPERMTEINTGGLPVSLVIVLQTGGSANRFLSTYAELPDLIGRLVGGSVHETSLVTFDSRVEEIWHFPVQTDGLDYALTHQHSGDSGAAIKDAVAFGVRQLQGEPGRFRRIVLLLSRDRDIGSSTSSQSLLEQLGTSSTVVYSVTFPAERRRIRRVREKRRSGSADEELTRADRGLDDQTAEEIAHLTGGVDFHFDDQRSFNSAMIEAISDFHNEITLGFQPSHSAVGFHHIDLQVDSPKLRRIFRFSI